MRGIPSEQGKVFSISGMHDMDVLHQWWKFRYIVLNPRFDQLR